MNLQLRDVCTFVDRFYQRMKAAPQELALIWNADDETENRISNADLDQAIQQRTNALGARNVSAGDVVVIVLPHRSERGFWHRQSNPGTDKIVLLCELRQAMGED